MAKRKINVLLAERQAVIKNILKKELAKSDSIHLLDAVDTKTEIVKFIRKNDAVEILLLDASLDVEENFTLTQFVKSTFEKVKILATIDAMDTLYIRKMIESGIDGFILKDANIETIMDAITEVQLGMTFYDKSIFDLSDATKASKVENMTNDELLNQVEKEILRLVASEFSVQEISDELRLEMQEVNKVIEHISKKTNTHSALGLQKYALKNFTFEEN